MLLRRVIEHVRAQNWTAVALDFVIVVMGVFIGFQVTAWNEARIDRATEKIYLQQLLEDFRENRTSLERTVSRTEQIITSMMEILEQSVMERPTWTADEFTHQFQLINSMPTFIANQSTYNNLLGSGDLALIRNRDLKNALAAYITHSDLIRLIQNTHELELVETFQPYIIEHLEFQAVARTRIEEFALPASGEHEIILEAAKTRRFRNIVILKWDISTDLLTDFRDALAATNAIIATLEAELKMEISTPNNAD